MSEFEPILTKNFSNPESRRLESYRRSGGYRALEKALKMQPDEIISVVKDSGLRGRGGAGFPTGAKWSFLPKDRTTTYLCINGDEAEPGTFMNRFQMERDPHMVLEGIIIAAYAIRAQSAYLYLRYEYPAQLAIMGRAVEEAKASNLVGKNILGSGFDLEVHLYRNAGAYIAGEETGLLESIEGKRPWPRNKPPFPAVQGLFGKPTIVNNVETLSCVPHIVERGAAWFKSMGTAQSAGPKLYGISGHVKKPGVYEFPMGVNLKTLIFDCAGGPPEGRKVKAVIPGGISTGVLTADQIDVPMAYESFSRQINGCLGLGTAGVVVMDDSTDMLEVLHNTARFFGSESCGQCTQCREGTGWSAKMTRRMLAGGGRVRDLDIILEMAERMGMMTGHSICGLSDGAAYPLRTIIEKFRGELEEGIGRRRRERPMVMSENMLAQYKATPQARMEGVPADTVVPVR